MPKERSQFQNKIELFAVRLVLDALGLFPLDLSLKIGERLGGLSDDVLDGYWTADAFLTWEPFDQRFALELAGYNLTGEDFDVATSTPGWSRTFTGSLKVRF